MIADSWRQIVNCSENEWRQCEKSIEELINVQTQEIDSLGIYVESPIISMARELHWECKVIPRWRKYSDRSFIHFGMNETVLKSAIQAGLEVMTNHKVKKFRIKNGIAYIATSGNGCKHEYRAKRITLSAGTIESPKILIQSGFAKPRDIKVNFHAMTRLVAVFKRAINDLHDIDPHQTWASDYSAKIGAAVSTPQLLAATKANLGVSSCAALENTGVYYVSTIPRGRGRFLNLLGNIMPFYSFSSESVQEIAKNTKILKESLDKAGAIEVLGNVADPSISTVHIFGSLPLGSTKVLDELGFVNGTNKIVRVCDGSVLPSAPAVNPQGPISVLCLLLSEKIHEKEWAN
jgi:choline dehydrogenase-like flavoprotein